MNLVTKDHGYPLSEAISALQKEIRRGNEEAAMCRSEKSRLADNFMTVVQQERAQKGLKLEVPDYALDKHTLKGKQKGRGWEFFNKVSSFIENKTDKFKDIYKARADLLRLTYQNVERFKAGSIDNRKLGKKTAGKQALAEDGKAQDDTKVPL